MPKGPLSFKVHSPERRRRLAVIAPCACCCCCCCLHTLGGLIGAATASGAEVAQFNAKAIFWRALGLSTLLAVIVGLALTSDPTIALVIVFLLMPGIQILASFFALIWLMKSSLDAEQMALARNTIGRITVRTVAGTMIGIALMELVAFAL